MTFVYATALALAALIVGPFVAHLLERRRADERPFPPARLVPPSEPIARKHRRIDERALYGVRTASILALALLGATPLVRCSSLAIGRHGGASIALSIVLDDSLSMLAKAERGTRWDRAKAAATDLLAGAREGDAVGIVLAGSPPRIALTSTTDLEAAKRVLEALGPSHRATDLDGALDLGRSLVTGLPQADRRVVLLSDLADGQPSGAPLAETGDVPVWIPLTDWPPARNCAVLKADRQRDRAVVRVACSPPAEARRRRVEIYASDALAGSTPLPDEAPGTDISVDVGAAAGELTAKLSGVDAILADDTAPVLATTGELQIAVVADPVSSKLVTGGPPPVEQALSALDPSLRVRPLPLLPDRPEELGAFAGIVIEDPPGLTPEARRSLGAWLERGGVCLLALGPHAPLSPLGASFEPLVFGPVGWGSSPVAGLDVSAAAIFGSVASGLADLGPRGRATIDLAKLDPGSRVLARWKDGAPWLVERAIGRGVAFVLTLPTSAELSDLSLRPGFLVLLETVVDATRAHRGAHRTAVGEAWSFDGASKLRATGPGGAPVRVNEDGGKASIVPDRVGAYGLTVGGDELVRVAAPDEREVDLRQRRASPSTAAAALGDTRARVNLSAHLALMLLALLAAELALRAWAGRIPRSRGGAT